MTFENCCAILIRQSYGSSMKIISVLMNLITDWPIVFLLMYAVSEKLMQLNTTFHILLLIKETNLIKLALFLLESVPLSTQHVINNYKEILSLSLLFSFKKKSFLLIAKVQFIILVCKIPGKSILRSKELIQSIIVLILL